MTLSLICLVVAIVLMILGSTGVPSGRVNLWQLGWAFVVIAWAFGGVVIAR
jgi:hypothetical protein